MRIGGLQKVTLLDYPGKVACTVFLPGCNLRCPFCHNPTLVLPDRETDSLSTEELLAFWRPAGESWTACASPAGSDLVRGPSGAAAADPGAGLCREAGHQRHQPDMLEALAQGLEVKFDGFEDLGSG